MRLEAPPSWNWNRLDAAWEEGCAYLERFAAREGHARVPYKHVRDGYRLGRWIVKQRCAHSAGRLADERAARLEALPGWTWNTN